jgi:hypothetical protein
VNNGTKVSQLGETNNAAFQSPGFGVRLAQPEEVTSSLLPPRSPCDLLEASLPSFVEFNEELSANVARDICEPRKLPTKLCQFVDLIKRGGEDPLVSWTGETKKTLLIREVPQEPQGGFPFSVPLDLSFSRVDPVAERLARDHGEKYAVGIRCRQATFARVGTLSTTSTLTWSSSRSTAARSSRLGSLKLSERAGVRSAATSRARWLNRTSNPTTFTSWSSTRRRLHSPSSSTPSRASRLDGSGKRTSPRFSGCCGVLTFGARAIAWSLAEERRLKSLSGTFKSKRETERRFYSTPPPQRRAVPPRPEGRGFPAEIR